MAASMTPVTEMAQIVAEGEWQAEWCRALGAPTWAAVIAAVLERLDSGAAAARLLRDDVADAHGSAVWLRLLGAVHRLVLDDPAVPLGRYFATAGGRPDPSRVGAVFLDFVDARSDAVAIEFARPVQTNEVARAGALSAAMNWLGGQLHLHEVGASAGLNLWMDRFRVVAGDRAWGPDDAAVVLDGLFDEGMPPLASFVVGDRRGCDPSPLSTEDPSAMRILRSFVWPDQPERLRRLDAAIATAGPVPIDTDGAAAWCRRQLDALQPGRTVVYHSIVMPYLSADERADFGRAMADAGERADDAHALAWVAFEITDAGDGAELTAHRWPEGDVTRLATLTPHGADIRWSPTRLD
jgi:hypothetical protein